MTPEGPRTGGVASYAASVASRLGLRTAIVTHAAASSDIVAALPAVDLLGLDAKITTIMEHRFPQGVRRQYVRARAAPISPHDIPERLRRTPMALLGPVIGEVDPSVAGVFPSALVGATVQGWLRRIGTDGGVDDGHVEDLDVARLAGRVRLITFSEEDLGDKPVPAAWIDAFEIVVMTRGADGLRLWQRGRCWEMGAFPADKRDATGAGDAFTAAFMIRYAETRDVAAAALFGSAVASLVVESPGIGGAPDRATVERRLRANSSLRLRPCRG